MKLEVEKKPIRYPWPIITEEIEEEVRKQLYTTLGTYDRSGITKEFEDIFKDFHGSKYALVTSSGTAALHSAFYALGLGPGDEVICQDYTFFATAMPLFQLGVLPILADCDENGGLLPSEIERLKTSKTKAVVLTHMWGNPCQMEKILSLCKKYDLKLVEDCSHAHGASYKGQYVGTFGDIGIWSLQSQKIVAAGEAGILVTNHRDYYEKAQLLGHFNKRALQEIDVNSANYSYAVTGTGLKYRPAALGLAIAKIHMKYLKKWIEAKNRNAIRIKEILADIPGLKILENSDGQGAYYAFSFLVDPDEAPFTREEMVAALQKEGFADIDIPKSTSSLHKYEIFKNPISPVTDYNGQNAIRGEYPNSVWITDHLVKLSVPVSDEEGSFGKYFIDQFEQAVKTIGR